MFCFYLEPWYHESWFYLITDRYIWIQLMFHKKQLFWRSYLMFTPININCNHFTEREGTIIKLFNSFELPNFLSMTVSIHSRKILKQFRTVKVHTNSVNYDRELFQSDSNVDFTDYTILLIIFFFFFGGTFEHDSRWINFLMTNIQYAFFLLYCTF